MTTTDPQFFDEPDFDAHGSLRPSAADFDPAVIAADAEISVEWATRRRADGRIFPEPHEEAARAMAASTPIYTAMCRTIHVGPWTEARP